MHLLLSHVAPTGPNCQAALPDLHLPQLQALLRLLGPGTRIDGDNSTLTPLSEQLHAQSLGLQAADGLLPWAALDAQRLPLPPALANQGWAWFTPCEWQINSDHVSMHDPSTLDLDATESETLLQAMRGYFAEDGLALYAGAAPGTWLACGELLNALPTASLERVSGASVDRWLCRQPQARPLRRLQNEMQMLLYTHPVNTARAAARRPLVSSFWVSGTGTLAPDFPPASRSDASITVDNRLRSAAQNDDATTWRQAWQALDQDCIAPLLQAARAGAAVQLTLCGEQAAQQFQGAPPGLWRRMHNRWHAPDPKALLRTL
jgi:hypothetical protein